MARIGSVASAPFVGDTFASLYLGAERVPTVPQTPAVTVAEWNGSTTVVGFSSDANTGGSEIIGSRYYFDGVVQIPDEDGDEFSTDFTGATVRIAVYNAIGDSLLSDPVVVVDNS